MADSGETGQASFRELERRAWTARAAAYDAWVGGITRDAVPPLLDAVGVRRGTALLDVACGPGYGAAMAVERGAAATGIDFAPTMVAEARRLHPGVAFREGDAERLDHPDGSFDAVVCAFGLLHLAEPDRAIAEAFRVLRPGGRYAFTVWAPPERHDFFRLVLDAIRTHGRMDVDLPPAPPLFRFSDPEECRRALEGAGFDDVAVRELPLSWLAPSPDAVIEMVERSTARAAMLLERQTPEAAERIRRSVAEGCAALAEGSGYRLAFPAVLAAARHH